MNRPYERAPSKLVAHATNSRTGSNVVMDKSNAPRNAVFCAESFANTNVKNPLRIKTVTIPIRNALHNPQ